MMMNPKKIFVSGSILGSLLILLFQNCAPAKLEGKADSLASSVGLTGSVGDKVNLASLLAAPHESSSNIIFPRNSQIVEELSYSPGCPMIENVILKNNDFSSFFWVHGPSSTIISKADSLEKLNFSPDLMGPLYVFAVRNTTPYLIASMNLVSKGSTNLNVNSVGAVQIVPTVISSDVLSETILIQVDAPDVDLSFIQFTVQNEPPVTGKKAILVTKKLAESVNVQISLTDMSGQSTVKTLNLFAKTVVPFAPVLTLSATSMNFGSVVLGSSSASQPLILTNSGTAALSFTSDFVFTGGYSLADVSDCSVSAPLAPGASCTLNIKFTARAIGSLPGTLTFSTTASSSPQTVSFSGTGTSAPAPALTLSATSFNFGNVPLGSVSSGQVLIFTNSGTANLTFTTFFTFSPGFTGGGNCSTTTPLAPGASCTLTMTYTPSVVGPQSGNLTISTNTSTPTRLVPLSGTGTSVPAAVVSGQNYKIISACGTRTLVMGVAGKSLTNNALMDLETRDDSLQSQTFKFETYDVGFRIIAQNSGRALNIANASTALKAPLEQYMFTGVASEIFKVQTTSDGYYRLQSVNSGLFVNLVNASTTVGNTFEQYSDSTSCSEKFILSPI